MRSKFLNRLLVEELSPDLWRLTGALRYQSNILNSVITAPEGFVTDFDSIPKWLPVTNILLKGIARRAAVIHDWLYQTHNCESKHQADKIFLEAMKSLSVSSPKRWTVYTAVKLFGGSSWKSGPKRLKLLGN